MKKIRKQTYTMDMYLNKVHDLDIRNDSDVQRQFVWSNEQINELIRTVLSDDYIPPIILGEEANSQLWIVDGGQRTAALNKFRYYNHKITSAIEDSMIGYKTKARDTNGEVQSDTEGNIIWENAVFDIKNKTYDKLPDELKKRFNEYQMETIIHEHCDIHRISQLIKRYNNHTAMNTNQKAFTYIDHFAREIREILETRFFLDCSDYKEKEKIKGVGERVIIETIMCTYHLAAWKRQTKEICAYLNQHSSKAEFDKLANNLHRLECIITADIKDIFNAKDSFLFLTLFDRFTKLGVDDAKFAGFLREFKKHLRKKSVEGQCFDGIDRDRGTKDKAVILSKLGLLETLMKGFLGFNDGNPVFSNKEIFIAETVGIEAEKVQDDMEFYENTLMDLQEKTIKLGSKLLEDQNRLSFLAMVAYSYKEDVDLDDWLAEYAKNHDAYLADQKKNYFHMVEDLNRFLNQERSIPSEMPLKSKGF
ncbi:MAG: DUF262 domain-containing protein [Lachnospiraceae bacterium]|nr:DUF262 domain-containing protein [Lachnospiraceae bacterium]